MTVKHLTFEWKRKGYEQYPEGQEYLLRKESNLYP